MGSKFDARDLQKELMHTKTYTLPCELQSFEETLKNARKIVVVLRKR
jgi:hypothetical protein